MLVIGSVCCSSLCDRWLSRMKGSGLRSLSVIMMLGLALSPTMSIRTKLEKAMTLGPTLSPSHLEVNRLAVFLLSTKGSRGCEVKGKRE